MALTVLEIKNALVEATAETIKLVTDQAVLDDKARAAGNDQRLIGEAIEEHDRLEARRTALKAKKKTALEPILGTVDTQQGIAVLLRRILIGRNITSVTLNEDGDIVIQCANPGQVATGLNTLALPSTQTGDDQVTLRTTGTGYAQATLLQKLIDTDVKIALLGKTPRPSEALYRQQAEVMLYRGLEKGREVPPPAPITPRLGELPNLLTGPARS